MSTSRQRAADLVSAYDHSLEAQILSRGSNLVCRDEELWTHVEGLLMDGDPRETHCLGLDPLRVMEESLKAAAALAVVGAGRVRARGGLQGLAKAFEVVEQAALNLYLGPWREEYKVVKMYSGMFTHYIKPVLSMPQIEKLFGLLGYQPSSSRHEHLRLQSSRVAPGSLDELLRLSCAFFLARCECRLLLAALGKHVGDAQWELSIVRERQRGNSLQVALDNTRKTLQVSQPQMKQFDGEQEEDLYTDEPVNGGPRGLLVHDDESPRSLTRVTQSRASPPVSVIHSITVTPRPSSPSLCSRDDLRISTIAMSAAGCDLEQARHPCEVSAFNSRQSLGLQAEAMPLYRREAADFCSCLQSSIVCLNLCTQCNTFHDITCASVDSCRKANHHLEFVDSLPKEMEQSGAVPPQGGSLGMSDMSMSLHKPGLSALALHDGPESMTPLLQPFALHECCNLAQLDPQALCFDCRVFHSDSCRVIDLCQSRHTVKPLGVCSCGKKCSRKPIVLCRYCGQEYCSQCWYRNPVKCACGQTFDQSSSV